MEHAIGEIVTLPDGRKAEVMEGGQCVSCCLFGDLCNYMKWDKSLECSYRSRTDHKNIIYKEIKEE